LENLFAAWQEFLSGKKKKTDVQEFGLRLADNIGQLHEELANFTYVHGPYKAFNISDPKPRNIHKASVRDRILHHAIYRKLYPVFDRIFIADSYSCRIGKGTYKAIKRFEKFALQVGKNNSRTAWVLKCDIKKFFASIDHKILIKILAGSIPDQNILWLLAEIIGSFNISSNGVIPSAAEESLILESFGFGCTQPQDDAIRTRGLPLGNLTSQLFCNVYMNEFDQFVKHKLKARHYVRYADDFVFLSDNKDKLFLLRPKISAYLDERLNLRLHPGKVFIKTLASGVDFLGWVNFPHHRVLRKTTGRRMFKRVYINPTNETFQSYLGLIRHGNTYKLK
jgi:retron-type reverse transcriptase